LQHSKVKLTWDTEDPERTKITRKKFTKEDLKDMDFKAYLASSSSEEEAFSDDDKEDLQSKYRALLEDADEQDKNEDMEITFTPGLSEKASKLLEKKKEKEELEDETVFEGYLRKRKEKKKLNKAMKAKDSEDGIILKIKLTEYRFSF
jgi:hypothetical protein